MADEPRWTEVLAEILDTRVRRVHTAMPGKVMSYNNTTQTADVEPQLHVDGEALSVLSTVPVIWPLAYGELSAGDTVLLVFCEADIGLWRIQGEAGAPQDEGRHGIHGAVALAGLRPQATPLDHTAGTTVLPGADVRLSEYDAAEQTLRASTWAAALSRTVPPGITPGFLTALTAWVTFVNGAIPVPAPTSTDMLAAIAEYVTGITGTWVSNKVKIP